MQYHNEKYKNYFEYMEIDGFSTVVDAPLSLTPIPVSWDESRQFAYHDYILVCKRPHRNEKGIL